MLQHVYIFYLHIFYFIQLGICIMNSYSLIKIYFCNELNVSRKQKFIFITKFYNFSIIFIGGFLFLILPKTMNQLSLWLSISLAILLTILNHFVCKVGKSGLFCFIWHILSFLALVIYYFSFFFWLIFALILFKIYWFWVQSLFFICQITIFCYKLNLWCLNTKNLVITVIVLNLLTDFYWFAIWTDDKPVVKK